MDITPEEAAFANPEYDPNSPFVDDILEDEINPSSMTPTDMVQHWRDTHKLFGNHFDYEYHVRPEEIEAKFREQRLRAKRNRRMP